MIPEITDCLRLMARYEMLDNIHNHSLQVARVAELLACELNRAGGGIDLPLAVTGAFLHDIGKTLCLNSSRNHAHVGRDICRRHGYDELAPLVEQHVILAADSFPAVPLSAKEVVYYADKRVNHDRVVSLEARCDYILARYGGLDDPARRRMIMINFERCREIEDGIFARLDFGPEDLAARLAAFHTTMLAGVTPRDVPGDFRV